MIAEVCFDCFFLCFVMGYVLLFRKNTTFKSTLLLLLLLSIIIIIVIVVVVMVWSGRIQATQSVRKGDHSRHKAIRIYFTACRFVLIFFFYSIPKMLLIMI